MMEGPMKRNRRGFMWMSIILEISLIMGVALYGLINPCGQDNKGGLIRLAEEEVSLLPSQNEEVVIDEGFFPTDEGGPYSVAPVLKMSKYRAKNGDSLWTIASEKGSDFFWTLLSVNRLKKADRISIGQELKIPNQCGLLHTVQKGETLEDISLQYGVNIRKIIRVNGVMDPAEIKQGSDLFIPGAKVSLAFSKQLLKESGVPPQFAWPCRRSSRISSKFGYRLDPFTKRRAFHPGLDLAPGYGASVTASMNGIVTYAGRMGGYGNLVVIRHSNGFQTRYGHLSRIRVKKGRYVSQGQVIGNVGSTGRSTGPHLHFEVRKNGRPQNPLNYIHR
jgi:LysM repeat protein